MTLVIDIETVSNLSPLDERQQEYVLTKVSPEPEKEGALNPFLGQICCVSLYSIETKKGRSYYIGEKREDDVTDDVDAKHYLSSYCSEEEVLIQLWESLAKTQFDQIVTFNGRFFDFPFLLLRSSILGIKPTVNLLTGAKWKPSVYKVGETWHEIRHYDLAECLTFTNILFANANSTGPLRRFSLDFYTRAFGIKSPKEEGVDGSRVGELYRSGRYRDIAEYCMRDVIATGKLFMKWNETLNF